MDHSYNGNPTLTGLQGIFVVTNILGDETY